MRNRIIQSLVMVALAFACVACSIVIDPDAPAERQTAEELQSLESTEPVVATVAPVGDTVKVPLIALEDYGVSGELVGCCDSLVWVDRPYITGSDPLLSAYTELLSIREIYYGGSGLYNAMYQSNLTVITAVVQDGIASIHLSGTIMMGGELDTPRVQAQLEQTALQFIEVSSVQVFINDIPLADMLSLK